MTKYTRITEQERYLIESGIRAGKSMRYIALSIGRFPSSVSRELRKNGGCLGYYSKKAHAERNVSNRKGYAKIDKIPLLGEYIRTRLKESWSPEVIAGRWN